LKKTFSFHAQGKYYCFLNTNLSAKQQERSLACHLGQILLDTRANPIKESISPVITKHYAQATLFGMLFPGMLRFFVFLESIVALPHLVLAGLAVVSICEVCGGIEIGSLVHLCWEMI